MRDLKSTVGGARADRPWRLPGLERLEGRALLSGSGYVLSGLQWSNPSRITYSIVADGVSWDHGVNNLNATMDARLGAGRWERELARALQTWAVVANINFVQVADDSLPFDTLGQSQGDSRFGDIRVGGYDFHDPTTLAQTYYPPTSGSSLTNAGDTEINTAIGWQIGSDYDLYSVMLHEFGHSLGLEHATNTGDVMAARYQGVRTGLTADDIAGIQSIYGPRTLDVDQSAGLGTSFATAVDLTAGLDASGQEVVSGVSLATVGDTEYFSVVAPAITGSRLQVTAIAGGVSLLSPQVTIYDASMKPLDREGNAGVWGENISANVAEAVPGQRYLIAVTGATNDVFAAASYQLQVAFVGGVSANPPTPTPTPQPPPLAESSNDPSTVGSGPSATAATPASQPAAIAPDRFEPNNDPAHATWLGSVTQVTTAGLTLDTPGDVDDFAIQPARPGVYLISAPGTSLRLLNARGVAVAQGQGSISFRSARPGGRYTVEVSAPGSTPVADYALTIALQGARGRSFVARPRPRFASFR